MPSYFPDLQANKKTASFPEKKNEAISPLYPMVSEKKEPVIS
jgi:hypothetical protein